MYALEDHIAKRMLCAAYEGTAEAHVEDELTPDAQAIDAWFEPDPARAAERESRGLMGRMMPDGVATIFEPYSSTPGPPEYRDCVRKQLTLDHLRAKEAEKKKVPRPDLCRLWVLSRGKPLGVLEGYAFTPIPEFPSGFWQRQPADAVGVVVLRDLPKNRETLLLRMMGGPEMRGEALGELDKLPEDAWERRAVLPSLLDLRVLAAQNPAEAEAKEFLMATNVAYEQMRQQMRDEAHKEAETRYEQMRDEAHKEAETRYEQMRQQMRDEGRKEAEERGLLEGLLLIYEARFNAIPAELRVLLEGVRDREVLRGLCKLVASPSSSAEKLVAAIRALPAKTHSGENGAA
jgi:hypothetical protein